MKWSRVPLTLLTPLILSNVLAVVGPTPLAAGPRHGSFSFGVHGPRFGFGFSDIATGLIPTAGPTSGSARPIPTTTDPSTRVRTLCRHTPVALVGSVDRALFEPS